MSNWSTADLADHYRRAGHQEPAAAACGDGKPSKYGNQPTVVDGVRFDSKAEARYWQTLRFAEQAGTISDLRRQVTFVLQERFVLPSGATQTAIRYVADMTYHREGRNVAVDVKGMETPVFKLKRKMFAAKFPEWELQVVKA